MLAWSAWRCDRLGPSCAGDVSEHPCENGCGYVVRRCEAHGGCSLGGAIGGHARTCPQAHGGEEPCYPAHLRFQCKGCGQLVRSGALHAHMYDMHGICCSQNVVRSYFTQEAP